MDSFLESSLIIYWFGKKMWLDSNEYEERMIFLYLLDDGNFVVVTDGVFAQEVKFHNTFAAVEFVVEGDVFNAQGAAAHRVCCLALFLLITSSQGQLQDHNRHSEFNMSLEYGSSQPSLTKIHSRLN